VLVIEKYEEAHWRIEEPDPIEAIKVRMEQRNLSRQDLEPFIGSKGKVSDVLNGNIGLSLAMIAKLSSGLDLSADLLIRASSWFRKNRNNLQAS
jgi:HTH-type transcriptional regulator/antitoxin HigA